MKSIINNSLKIILILASMLYTNDISAQNNIDNLQVDKFTTSNGTSVNFYCIKHGTLALQIGEKWLYFDPVTKAVKPETDFTNFPKADYIFITHEHQDHLDSEAIKQLCKRGTKIFINKRSNEIIGGIGNVMQNGDYSTIENGWRIDAVAAYNNTPERMQFHPQGRDNGYILSIDGFRIYVAGDTENIPEMTNIKNIDVAFLPCNLPFTMSPEQLANAVKTIKPKVLFPYHYGQTNIQNVVDLLKDSNIDIRIRQYQ